MTDLNDVKGGSYQLVAQRWDKITSKPGQPLTYDRYRRGDIVELNDADAKRLVKAGAVVKPGQLAKSAAEDAKRAYEAAKAEFDAILAGLPEDVRAEVAPDTVSNDPDNPPSDPPAWWAQFGDKGPETDKVEDLLTFVDTDVAKAQAALEAEQAGKARKTALEGLQAVITAGRGQS